MKVEFITSEDIRAFEISTYKDYPIESLSAKGVAYYEWNAEDKIWMKLNPNHPDPPDLAAGKFDGQIAEINI